MKTRYFDSVLKMEKFNKSINQDGTTLDLFLGYSGFTRTKSGKIAAKYRFG